MKNTLSDRLNYLTTIAEEQSITRAATRLFISQPALTAFLSRTEEELGTRLFDRTSTPIRIGCKVFCGRSGRNHSGNIVYLNALFHKLWLFDHNIVKECMDCAKPLVTCGRRRFSDVPKPQNKVLNTFSI